MDIATMQRIARTLDSSLRLASSRPDGTTWVTAEFCRETRQLLDELWLELQLTRERVQKQDETEPASDKLLDDVVKEHSRHLTELDKRLDGLFAGLNGLIADFNGSCRTIAKLEARVAACERAIAQDA